MLAMFVIVERPSVMIFPRDAPYALMSVYSLSSVRVPSDIE